MRQYGLETAKAPVAPQRFDFAFDETCLGQLRIKEMQHEQLGPDFTRRAKRKIPGPRRMPVEVSAPVASAADRADQALRAPLPGSDVVILAMADDIEVAADGMPQFVQQILALMPRRAIEVNRVAPAVADNIAEGIIQRAVDPDVTGCIVVPAYADKPAEVGFERVPRSGPVAGFPPRRSRVRRCVLPELGADQAPALFIHRRIISQDRTV